MTDEELQERLAEKLRYRPVSAPWRSRRRYGDQLGGYYALDETSVQGLLADLLPEVKRYAAEQLREAAERARVVPQVQLTLGEVADKLDELADALAALEPEP